MSIFEELKRRNVFRVGIAYLVGGWLLLQLTEVLSELLKLPDTIGPVVVALVVIGFPVALFFAWAFELTPEGVKREKDVDRERSIARQTGKKLNVLIISMLVVALAYFVWESRFMERPAGPMEPESSAAAEDALAPSGESDAPDSPEDNSVAVLPFVNMSADPDNEYFSDGLTETLLHMLAQLDDLRVAARTSSFSFKGKDAPIREIADVLNVAHVLEGSVQRAAGQVRVTAQLIRADDGFHVWSQNYTRPLEDIFALQDEIATDVANALDSSLLGGMSKIHGPATTSLDAYETYLKAMDEQTVFSYGGLEAAEGLFKRALAQDPEFLEARLALARNYLLMNMTGLLDREETRRAFSPLLEQVEAAHPGNPQARAYELVFATEWPAVFAEMTFEEMRVAMNELRGLLAVIPDEWMVRYRVSQLVEGIENDEQSALEVLQAGLLVDPRSAFLWARIGDQLRDMERYEEAEAALMRAAEFDPDQPGVYTRLARLARARNNVPASMKWMRRAIQADPQDHEMAAGLARDFYEFKLTEEGNRWSRRVAALVPDSDFVRSLAVAQAESEDDWQRVMDLAGKMIEDRATQREGIFGMTVGAYADAAIRSGQAEEAYRFLMSIRPEAADFERPPPDAAALDVRMTGLFLMREFGDRDALLAAWKHSAAQLEARGWNWDEVPAMRMFDKTVRGDYEAAVSDALEVLETPLAQNPHSHRRFSVPSLAPLRQHPEVAASVADREREWEEVRESVIAMLEGQEWQ